MTCSMRWASSLVVLLAASGCEVDYETDPEPDAGVHVEERTFEAPDVEMRESPDVNVHESPDVNVREERNVHVEEQPDLEVNESPDVEVNESPDIEVESTPQTDQPQGSGQTSAGDEPRS